MVTIRLAVLDSETEETLDSMWCLDLSHDERVSLVEQVRAVLNPYVMR